MESVHFPWLQGIQGVSIYGSSLIVISAEPKRNHDNTTDECLALVDIGIFTLFG
jgi:hypothetical protein